MESSILKKSEDDIIIRDKSVFLEMLGDSPILKILDFLIIHEEFDYSMTDIAEFSEVAYSTLKNIWKKLEEKGLVKHTRTVGKAKMYKLNTENENVKKLKKFYWEITKNEVHKEINQKK